ncbi:MAG: hypothetical protein HKN04_15215, partial [Rhodothermaceae bacterium]|nr:hypothetical protein [Rhodothermaceae bacterium]
MRFAVLLTLALVATSARGQSSPPFVFDRLHSADGLSHNTVQTIHQDRDGFMWFGTLDGLNRYDGYEFIVYRHHPADSTSLSSSIIRSLHEDEDGTLWVGTQAGLCRMSYGETAFACFTLRPGSPSGSGNIFAMERDSTGTLWIGSADGLHRFDEPRHAFDAIQAMQGHSVVALRVRPDGLWVLATARDTSAAQTLTHIDLSSHRVTQSWEVAPEWGLTHSFTFDQEGAIWLNALGPAIRDGDVLRPANPGDYEPAYAALTRSNGIVLLASVSGRGLLVCRASVGCIANIVDAERKTWLNNFVRSIYEDRSGAVWVGTYGGVYRHDPYRKPFTVLKHDVTDPTTLSSDAISAVVRPPGSAYVWTGSFDGGLNRVDPTTGEVMRYEHARSNPAGIPPGAVWDLHVDQHGAIWLAGDFGLVRFDPRRERFERHEAVRSALQRNGMITIEEEADGTLWVGAFGGLARYDPRRGVATAYPVADDHTGPSLASITAMHLDGKTLWLGGDGGEVNSLDLETGRFEHLQPTATSGEVQTSETVYDLASGEDGRMMMGTGAGLFVYDQRSGHFQHITPADGLPGSVVYTIQIDRSGQVWLGTNRGLAVFDGDSTIVRTYDLADGIGSMEFNRHARFMDGDGIIYLGGGEGLTWFDPSRIRDNPV